jgi:hypothetical protein
MKPVILALALTFGVALSTSALARPHTYVGGDDVVITEDGTVWRGRITQNAPHDHVNLRLADGRVATIPWALVVRVNRPAEATISGPARGPTVHVHIEPVAGLVITLWRSRLDDRGRDRVCHAPCDQDVSTLDDYWISGPSMRASKRLSFRDVAQGGTVSLSVGERARDAGYVGGILLAVLGGITVGVGTLTALYGAAMHSPHAGYFYVEDPIPFYEVGGAVAGVGALLLAGGIALKRSNGETEVTRRVDYARAATWTKRVEPVGPRRPPLVRRVLMRGRRASPSRSKSSRALGAVTAAIAVTYGASVACHGMTADELHCEEAVAWMKSCCPGFAVDGRYCAHEDPQRVEGCSGETLGWVGGQDPALVVSQSDCVRSRSCSELVLAGVCKRAESATPIAYVDGGPPPSGAAEVCP